MNELSTNDYCIWEVFHEQSLGPVRFVCLEFWERPDDGTRMLLKQSHFMYGYFEGIACWHAMHSEYTRALVEDIARGAAYDWNNTPAWEIPPGMGDSTLEEF